MSHTTIRALLFIKQIRKDLWITTVLDDEGNTATGVGKDYTVGEKIITFYDDKYQRVKFTRTPHQIAHSTPNKE